MRVDLRPYRIEPLDPSFNEFVEVLEPKVVATIETPLLSTAVQNALIDSGSYATYFFTSMHLPHTPHTLLGAGRNKIPASYARANILIQNDGTSYSWEANILLTNVQVPPVLGYIGFFEFFTVSIDSIAKIVEFIPNTHFRGRKSSLW